MSKPYNPPQLKKNIPWKEITVAGATGVVIGVAADQYFHSCPDQEGKLSFYNVYNDDGTPVYANMSRVFDNVSGEKAVQLMKDAKMPSQDIERAQNWLEGKNNFKINVSFENEDLVINYDDLSEQNDDLPFVANFDSIKETEKALGNYLDANIKILDKDQHPYYIGFNDAVNQYETVINELVERANNGTVEQLIIPQYFYNTTLTRIIEIRDIVGNQSEDISNYTNEIQLLGNQLIENQTKVTNLLQNITILNNRLDQAEISGAGNYSMWLALNEQVINYIDQIQTLGDQYNSSFQEIINLTNNVNELSENLTLTEEERDALQGNLDAIYSDINNMTEGAQNNTVAGSSVYDSELLELRDELVEMEKRIKSMSYDLGFSAPTPTVLMNSNRVDYEAHVGAVESLGGIVHNITTLDQLADILNATAIGALTGDNVTNNSLYKNMRDNGAMYQVVITKGMDIEGYDIQGIDGRGLQGLLVEKTDDDSDGVYEKANEVYGLTPGLVEDVEGVIG